jgi:hypothetical protein
MKNIKKLVTAVTLFGVLGVSVVVYAADSKSPAELASELTGKSISEVQTERNQGKTYGTIASEVGKLEEFKEQRLEQKKAILDERVKDGVLTQEQADNMYDTMMNNQAICDGTGNMLLERKAGTGTGRGGRMGINSSSCFADIQN